MTRWTFARARLIRLYPAFLACMAITLAWEWLCTGTMRLSLGDLLLNLTMLPLAFGADPVDPVYWTLGYEIGFYATVWACLPWLRRDAEWRPTSGVSVPTGGGGASTARASGTWKALPFPVLWLCLAMLPVAIIRPVVGWFILGMVIYEYSRAEILQRIWTKYRHLRYGRRAGTANFVQNGDARPSDTYREYNDADGNGTTLRCHSRGFGRFCSWAGAVSYPLYLLHYVIGQAVLVLLYPAMGLWPALLTTCGAMIALAWAVHRWIERPVQAWLRAGRYPGYGTRADWCTNLSTTQETYPTLSGSLRDPLRMARTSAFRAAATHALSLARWLKARLPTFVTPVIPEMM